MLSHTAKLERALVAAAALALVASLASVAVPFLHDGLPSGHDATAHITYTYLFDRALSQGQMPVRWVEWVHPGESQPLFNFYPPGLYYLVGAVHALGVPLSVALKATVVLVCWCGALLTYGWLSRLGRLPAGLAALLFVLSPYVMLDVFVRASYPELAAIACAPGVLWSIDRTISSSRLRDAIVLAGFVGLMLLCHLLTSLIFAPVLAAYAGVRMWPTATPRRLALLALGGVLGFGLAAFYVVPSMVELHFVSIGRMTSGDADYQRHFVGVSQWFRGRWGYGASVPGLDDGLSFRMDVLQWLALVLSAVWLVRGRRPGRSGPRAGTIAFWLVAVVAAMFLMTQISAPLWHAIPALPYLQFPWRYLMVVSVGTSALAALLLASIRNRTVQALIVIGAVAIQYPVHHRHMRPQQYYERDAIDIDNPRWAEVEALGMRAFIERGFMPVDAHQPPPPGTGRWTVIAGEADVRALHEADDRLALEVHVPTTGAARLRLNTHYFPGWHVLVDGAASAAAVDERYGFMEVAVPRGTHRVEAVFADTPVRSAANMASALSIALCLGGLVWDPWGVRRQAFHSRKR